MLEFVDKLDWTTILYMIDYRKRFNALDTQVRKHSHVTDAVATLTPYERALLLAVTKYIDQKTAWKPFNSIKWRIGKSQHHLENNLPHTHGDVIILSNRFKDQPFETVARILFHEKVHIFQRTHPLHTFKLFTTFWRLRLVGYTDTSLPNSRTNPDTNRLEFDLYNPETQSMGHYEAEYTSSPKRLTDIEYVFRKSATKVVVDNTYHDMIHRFNINQYEHPNETMACVLTLIVFDGLHHRPTMHWINTHLKQRAMD